MFKQALFIAVCLLVALVGCARKPLTPVTPWVDLADDSLSFFTTSTDPGDLKVCYIFDWGDGSTTTTDYCASGDTTYCSHGFSDTRVHYVKVRARNEKGAASGWSPSLRFRLTEPPQLADTIVGLPRWATDRWYRASVRVTDPEGDSVAVRFLWGDLPAAGWSGFVPSGSVVTDSCQWSVAGPHDVRVVLKDRGCTVSRPGVVKTVSVSTMAVVWQTGEDLFYEATPTLGQIDGEPVLYCVEYDGTLDCYTLAGQKRWSSPLPGTTGYAASLSADGSRLYLTTGDDTGMVCLDSRTGRHLWSLAGFRDACCTPALGPDGATYVVTTPAWDSDYLRRVRDFGDSAKVEWSLFLGVASPVDKGAVVGRDGTVYAVGYDYQSKCSFLLAVDSGGVVLWQDSARIQIGGTPVIDSQDRILVADLNGGIYCYNPDGTLAWNAATEGLSPVSTAIGMDDQVIVTTDELAVIKNYDSQGNERWASSGELELSGWNTPCVAQNSTLIAFDGGSGYVYGINDAGLPLWQFSVYDSLYGDDKGRALRPEANFGSPVIGPNGDLYLTIEDGLVCVAHGGLKMANTAWPTYNHDNAHSGWAGRQ
jgi:hypothetical protein